MSTIKLCTVSTKRQFAIPKAIFDRLHLAAGDKIELHDTPEGVLIKKHPKPVPQERTYAKVTWRKNKWGTLCGYTEGPKITPEDVRNSWNEP